MLKPPPDWPRALTLLDQALALRPEARAEWLESTAAREPSVSPLLRKLLSAHRRVETHSILATLPRSLRNKMSVETGQIGLLIGPFELLESLGRGGMGSVWRARYADGRLKRDVAVKLPAASDEPAALAALRERFARERDFLGQLEHPNIARLYDTGVSDDGQPFLAMEYVVGKPIDEYCDDQRLNIKARLSLFLQVLDAVEYAHRQLVLHRDLKPGNVLVDDKGQVRLLDFGVAKLLPPTTLATATNTGPDAPSSTGTDLTEMAGAAITLAYAAPEQISGLPLSTATDVYALGVMLYRLLTGLSPYQPARDTRGSLEDEVLIGVPETASARVFPDDALTARQTTAPALRKVLRGDLEVILNKALKKSAGDRYLTVNAFSEDVRRQRAQQPINARPDSPWYRTQRLVARHRVAVAASAFGVVALVTTTGVAVWQATVATANAARANNQAQRASAAQKFAFGLFGNADPEKFKGSGVSAKELLDRGRVSAEREFANDPETLADVLGQIGGIYNKLGLPDETLSVYQRRLAVVNSLAAANINQQVDAQLAVGEALTDSSHPARIAEALPMLQAAYKNAISGGAEGERVVWAMCLLADFYRLQRNYAEARPRADEAVASAEQRLKSPNRYLAAAYNIRAVISRDEGRSNAARADFDAAIAIDATGKGRGPLDQLIVLTQLAQLEHDSGNYLRAADLALKVIGIAEQNMGDLRMNIAPARRAVVFAYERAGDHATARRFADSLMPDELASGQPMRVAQANLALARLAMSEGKLTKAAEAFEQAAPTLETSAVWRSVLDIQRTELSLRVADTLGAFARVNALHDRQIGQKLSQTVAFARTLEMLAVTEARLGRMVDARSRIDAAASLLSTRQAANHPFRARVDAYAILLDLRNNSSDRAANLRALADRVASGRTDQITLVPALRALAKQLESGFDPSLSHSQFPLLF